MREVNLEAGLSVWWPKPTQARQVDFAMTDAVFDFRSIRRKLERQEQKAEFDKENPEPSMYGWPYGVAVPFVAPESDPA